MKALPIFVLDYLIFIQARARISGKIKKHFYYPIEIADIKED